MASGHFFYKKMLPAANRYETHNGELLAIFEDFKTWKYYLEATSMKFSYLQAIITSNALWAQKAWVLGKSTGLKSCQSTTFKLIIVRAKLIELLMPCHNTPSGVLRKKKFFEPRIPRSCIDYNLCWLEFRGWKFWGWTFWGWTFWD